jgi:hypothetical protein
MTWENSETFAVHNQILQLTGTEPFETPLNREYPSKTESNRILSFVLAGKFRDYSHIFPDLLFIAHPNIQRNAVWDYWL